MRLIRAFISDESGAPAIEYALVATIISISIVAAALSIGTKVSSKFSAVAGNLS